MRPPKVPGFFTVIRPSVLAAMVYFSLCSIGALWVLCTTRFPTIESGEPLRLLPSGWLPWITLTNVLFALAFCVDARQTLRGPAELRIPGLAGLVLAFVVLALVQVGTHIGCGS